MHQSTSCLIVALRHAHRTVGLPTEDNGLSPKGQAQTQRLTKAIIDKWGKSIKWKLLSSPKLRCQETLSLLEKELDLEIIVSPELDEQGPSESSIDMIQRISQFVENLESHRGNYILCSHGDWIPMFQEIIVGQSDSISKADALLFKKEAKNIKWSCSYLPLGSKT